MHEVKKEDYMKKVGNFIDMSPYYSIELVDNVGLNIWFSNRERYYIEIDKRTQSRDTNSRG